MRCDSTVATPVSVASVFSRPRMRFTTMQMFCQQTFSEPPQVTDSLLPPALLSRSLLPGGARRRGGHGGAPQTRVGGVLQVRERRRRVDARREGDAAGLRALPELGWPTAVARVHPSSGLWVRAKGERRDRRSVGRGVAEEWCPQGTTLTLQQRAATQPRSSFSAPRQNRQPVSIGASYRRSPRASEASLQEQWFHLFCSFHIMWSLML